MKNDDVDEYIAGFKDLLTKIDYKQSHFGVIEKFKHGLKKWIVRWILARDKWPTDLKEWQEPARQEVWRSTYIWTTMGDKRNFDVLLQEAKWKAALQIPEGRKNHKKRQEAVPMEVNFALT